MGQSETSLPLLGGPGESPFFVTKKFGLHQSLWNCGAVDPDHRSFMALAVVVNGPCDQFLARAGFAEDEH